MRAFMEALVWGRRESARDKLESLILAQNERWLFFAEAKHTVTLYYGVDVV